MGPWGSNQCCSRVNCVLTVKNRRSRFRQFIQDQSPRGNQPWIFIGRTDAEAPILWPPDGNKQLTGKDPDAGKDWRQEERATEDEVVGWHHWFNGHEFKQTPEDSEGQGSPVCCSPWGHRRVRHNLSDWKQALRGKGGVQTLQGVGPGVSLQDSRLH